MYGKPKNMRAQPLDVSVVIPAYRAEHTIARALNSVIAQSKPPREVIVVIDGSPDNTGSVAEIFCDKFQNTKYTVIHQENAGAGAARNLAVKTATSTYLAFLDADDAWLPEKLSRSFAVMEHSGLGLVAHNYASIAADGTTSAVDCAARFRKGPDPYSSLYRRGYLATSTLVVRRDLVTAAGGFDPSLPNAQDFDLWLAILQDRSIPFEVFDEALTHYYVTEGSITAHTERRIQCCLDIALRFAPSFSSGKYTNLWMRTLAVYFEAMHAYRKKNQEKKATLAIVRSIPALISITFMAIFSTPTPRPRLL